MASITLTFSNQLNASCQVGDIAHAVTVVDSGGFSTNNTNNIVKIGEIREIVPFNGTSTTVICSTSQVDASNCNNKFILFSKNESINLSSILGYYAETKFVCSDINKAELFSVGTEVFQSSK